MNRTNLIHTTCRAAAAIFLGILIVGCGSGGGDKAGVNAKAYSISGAVSGVQAAVTLSLSGDATAQASSDPASGAFSFANLALGSYQVTPSLNGYSFNPSTTTVKITGSNITLPAAIIAIANTAPTYTISGIVSGAVQQGVLISLSGAGSATTTTAANGSYSIPGLASGSYTITPTLSGYTFTQTSQTVVDLHADTPAQNFVAAANTAPTYSLSGTVSGATLQNVLITLSGSGTATATTDSSGNYIFAGLSANNGYIVTPSKLGYTFSLATTTVPVSASVTGINFIATGMLNDTGITNMQCYQAASSVLGSCSSTGLAATLNATQDGMVGRDVTVADSNPSDGKLGFSYTKVCNNGQLGGSSSSCSPNAGLGSTAVDWGCTQDNVTGLMWEVKTKDMTPGPRDWTIKYTNYDSTSADQKGTGTPPTPAEIAAATNSIGFKNSVNTAGLCGHNDWRLPTADELQSIVDYGVNVQGLPTPVPVIDANWFLNTQGNTFWSSSPDVGGPADAWVVFFSTGFVLNGSRGSSGYVRLVRAGQ